MTTVRQNSERHRDRRRNREGWLTFASQDQSDPLARGFGALDILDEHRLAPSASLCHPARDAEILTFVREGTLGHEDSFGRSGIIHAGEFHRMLVGRGARHSMINGSRTDSVHFFQIWFIGPNAVEVGAEVPQQQKRFSTAERRGVLCLVASPDAQSDSLRMRANVLIYSALLQPGQHVVHPLAADRRAWLHLVHGRVRLGDRILAAGDGAAITAERAVSLTAQEDSEILLVNTAGAYQSQTSHYG
jgi:redox-sensitive bicupin YhaK (pirin superfamily)